MTMHRIACNFPPARRAAYAISMSHDQRSLVLSAGGVPTLAGGGGGELSFVAMENLMKGPPAQAVTVDGDIR